MMYLPPKNKTDRPIDVARKVTYYAERQGVTPTKADYFRAGYAEALGRFHGARVAAGWSIT